MPYAWKKEKYGSAINEYAAEHTWRRQFGAFSVISVAACAHAIQRSEPYAVRLLNKLAKLGVVHLAETTNGLPTWYIWGKNPMPRQKFKKSDCLDCSECTHILAEVYRLS